MMRLVYNIHLFGILLNKSFSKHFPRSVLEKNVMKIANTAVNTIAKTYDSFSRPKIAHLCHYYPFPMFLLAIQRIEILFTP